MRKAILFAVALMALPVLPAVAADNGFYLGGSVGQANLKIDDLSDGIPRIAESALQKAAKQASRKKILQKATKETGYDLGPSLIFVSFCPFLVRANCFKCAVFRRPVLHQQREFHLASDQVCCFKLSCEHQCPSLAPDVPKQKFHRARETDRFSFATAPLCLRRFVRSPNFGLWVGRHQSAFSIALRIKAHGAVLVVREGDLDVPSANHVRRFCLSEEGVAGTQD